MIVITGATGLLGCEVSRRLAEKRQLRILSRMPCPGTAQARRHNYVKENIQSLQWFYNRKPLKDKDAFDLQTLANTLEHCKTFYHFAALSASNVPQEKIGELACINMVWTAILFSMANLAHVNRVVFASTQLIYNFEDELPKECGIDANTKLNFPSYRTWLDNVVPKIWEFAQAYVEEKHTLPPLQFSCDLMHQYPPFIGKGIYGLSKVVSEELITILRSYGVEGINIRPSSVFGPSMVDTPVIRSIPKIIRSLLCRSAIEIPPRLNNTVFLPDFGAAIAGLEDISFAPPQALHFAAYRESLEKIARMLMEIAGSNVPIVIKGPPIADPLLDMSQTEQDISFTTTPFLEALKATYNFYAEHQDLLA